MAPSRRIVSPFSIGLLKIETTSLLYSTGSPSREGHGTMLPSSALTFLANFLTMES